jgi:hypothetical protein
MMDGFGFPAGAGRFRFRGECKIASRLIHGANTDGCVLDLGLKPYAGQCQQSGQQQEHAGQFGHNG